MSRKTQALYNGVFAKVKELVPDVSPTSAMCLKQLHVVHIKVFLRMQYTRLLLIYSVIFQSVIFQSCKFQSPAIYFKHAFNISNDLFVLL